MLGLALLALGVALLLFLLFAAAIRAGFGGADTPAWLFAIPIAVIVGGPAYFWLVRPYRRKTGRRSR